MTPDERYSRFSNEEYIKSLELEGLNDKDIQWLRTVLANMDEVSDD